MFTDNICFSANIFYSLFLKNESYVHELNFQHQVAINDDLEGDPDEEINLNNQIFEKEDDEDEVEFEEVLEPLTQSTSVDKNQIRISLRKKSADVIKSHALDSIRFSMFNIKSEYSFN